MLICVTDLIPPAELEALIPKNHTAAELKTFLAQRLKSPIPKRCRKTTNKRHAKNSHEKTVRRSHLGRKAPQSNITEDEKKESEIVCIALR